MNREGYQQRGLYDPAFEHDACGIGAVVDIKGRQSYETVDSALKIVEKLEHRAGKDAEGKTGDGVGILLQISHQFFQKAATECGIQLGEARDYGVGMFFFPQDTLRRNQAKKMFEVIVAKEGMGFLGWRKVPVCPEVLGQKALSKMPNIQQAFVKRPGDAARGLEFDRRLYVARRVFEQSNDNTYVPSLSSRTVVYKGMFLVGELRKFYLDLQNRDYHSAIACVHSRFSTNTNPSWERAHPNRLILHNGEINTIRGNADRMLAREETMSNPVIDDALDKIYPVVNGAGSDSAMLDNTLEFLVMSGMDLPLAVMVTIPEPWTKDGSISRAKRDLDAAKQALTDYRKKNGNGSTATDNTVEETLQNALEEKTAAYLDAQKELTALQWRIENAVNTALNETGAQLVKNGMCVTQAAEEEPLILEEPEGELEDAGAVDSPEQDTKQTDGESAQDIDIIIEPSDQEVNTGSEPSDSSVISSAIPGVSDTAQPSTPSHSDADDGVASPVPDRELTEQQVRDTYAQELDAATKKVETAKKEKEAAEQALMQYQQEQLTAADASGKEQERQLLAAVQTAGDAYEDAVLAANEAAVTAGRAVAAAGISDASDSTLAVGEITVEQMELQLAPKQKRQH